MAGENNNNNQNNNNGEPTEPTEPQNTNNQNNNSSGDEGKVDGKTAAEWKAEHDKWKGHSRTWETRATNSEKELGEYKAKHGSDEEKAIEKAKEEGRSEERAKYADTMVELKFRAANNGRLSDTALDAIIPGLNRSQFMSANGNDVDDSKVESFIAGIAPANPGNGNNQNQNNNQNNQQQHGAGGNTNNNRNGDVSKGTMDDGAELYKNRSSTGRRF